MRLSLLFITTAFVGSAMAKCWYVIYNIIFGIGILTNIRCLSNNSINEHYTKLACRKTGSLLIEGNNTYCFKGVTLQEWERVSPSFYTQYSAEC